MARREARAAALLARQEARGPRGETAGAAGAAVAAGAGGSGGSDGWGAEVDELEAWEEGGAGEAAAEAAAAAAYSAAGVGQVTYPLVVYPLVICPLGGPSLLLGPLLLCRTVVWFLLPLFVLLSHLPPRLRFRPQRRAGGGGLVFVLHSTHSHAPPPSLPPSLSLCWTNGTQSLLAESHYNLALLLHEAGALAEAVDHYTAALAARETAGGGLFVDAKYNLKVQEEEGGERPQR